MYTFNAISSAGLGGVRDVAVDLTNMLETSETVSSVVVTSSNTDIVTISAEAVNTGDVTLDGTTVLANKGATFRLTTILLATSDIKIYVAFVGSSATEDSIEIILPVVDYLRS